MEQGIKRQTYHQSSFMPLETLCTNIMIPSVCTTAILTHPALQMTTWVPDGVPGPVLWEGVSSVRTTNVLIPLVTVIPLPLPDSSTPAPPPPPPPRCNPSHQPPQFSGNTHISPCSSLPVTHTLWNASTPCTRFSGDPYKCLSSSIDRL